MEMDYEISVLGLLPNPWSLFTTCSKLGLFCPIVGRSFLFSITWWLCFDEKCELHTPITNCQSPSRRGGCAEDSLPASGLKGLRQPNSSHPLWRGLPELWKQLLKACRWAVAVRIPE